MVDPSSNTSSLLARSSNNIGNVGDDVKRSGFIFITVMMGSMESRFKVRPSTKVCHIFDMMCKKHRYHPLSTESFSLTFDEYELHSSCQDTLDQLHIINDYIVVVNKYVSDSTCVGSSRYDKIITSNSNNSVSSGHSHMGPSNQGTITSISSVSVPTPTTAHANSNDDVVEDNDDRNATGASKQIKATSRTGLITNKRPNPASMKIPLLGTSTSSSATSVDNSSFNAVPQLKSNSALTAIFSNNHNGEVGGWINAKKSKADIRKCAAIAREARSRLLADTDEESSVPPDRLEQFKTIYDGTTTTSNNVFSNDPIPTFSNDTLLPIIELYAIGRLDGNDNSNNDSSGNNYANNDSDKEENVDQHNDFCHECSEGGEVLCCGNCTLVFHLKCIGMDGVPEGNWLCQYCVDDDMDISSSNEEDEDLSPSDDDVGSVYSMSIDDEDSDVEVSVYSDDTFDDKEDVELSCVTKRAPTPARNNGSGQVGHGMSTTSNIDHYSSTIITNANDNAIPINAKTRMVTPADLLTNVNETGMNRADVNETNPNGPAPFLTLISTNADDSTTTTHNVTNDATSSTIPIGASWSTTPIGAPKDDDSYSNDSSTDAILNKSIFNKNHQPRVYKNEQSVVTKSIPPIDTVMALTSTPPVMSSPRTTTTTRQLIKFQSLDDKSMFELLTYFHQAYDISKWPLGKCNGDGCNMYHFVNLVSGKHPMNNRRHLIRRSGELVTCGYVTKVEIDAALIKQVVDEYNKQFSGLIKDSRYFHKDGRVSLCTIFQSLTIVTNLKHVYHF